MQKIDDLLAETNRLQQGLNDTPQELSKLSKAEFDEAYKSISSIGLLGEFADAQVCNCKRTTSFYG